MKTQFKVWLHCDAGTWSFYEGYILVSAVNKTDAVTMAKQELRKMFPDRPSNVWHVDSIAILK